MAHKLTTLVYLLRGKGDARQVLLAMKKRSHGEGKWNGPGGKVQEGESVETAAIRETKEEVNVEPSDLQHKASITFHFWGETDTEAASETMTTEVFLGEAWNGEPSESEEMRPQWFKLSAVPYADMWPDDKYWLPDVFAGRELTATFHFDKQFQITKFEVEFKN